MSVRHTLLGLLEPAPMHGYALRELARFSWAHPVPSSTVYPSLRQLEREGLVTHTTEVHQGRARKIYGITEAGRSELLRWLSDGHHQPPAPYRDPVLVKLSLLRGEAAEAAAEWIERERGDWRAKVSEVRRFVWQVEKVLSPFTRLVAEHAIELAEARVRLYDRILSEIEAQRAGAGSRRP